MKNVIVIGAGGSLARYVVEALLLQEDVHLTLFLRDKKRLNNPSNVTVIEGDATDYDKLKKAIHGQDIVYVNLSGNLEAMAKNIVTAMQETGVKRIIAISSIGIYQTPLQPILIPYRKLADTIEASGLDYTLLRPNWFTNGKEIDYQLTTKGKPETGTAVSRKSIASFIGGLVKSPEQYVHENLNIARPQ